MLKEMIPEIIARLSDQKYDEAFVNLEGLMYFMHENLTLYSSDQIFCVVLAHDALVEILLERNYVNTSSCSFEGIIEYLAHLAVLRLQEALGDEVSKRAARALSLCLEALINRNQEKDGEEE